MLSPARASLLGERRTFSATLAMAVCVMGACSSAASSCARAHRGESAIIPASSSKNSGRIKRFM